MEEAIEYKIIFRALFFFVALSFAGLVYTYPDKSVGHAAYGITLGWFNFYLGAFSCSMSLTWMLRAYKSNAEVSQIVKTAVERERG